MNHTTLFNREERIWFKCRSWKKWVGDRIAAPELHPIQLDQYLHSSGDSYYWMGGTGSKRLEFKYNQKLLIPTLASPFGKEEVFYKMTRLKYMDIKVLAEYLDGQELTDELKEIRIKLDELLESDDFL